MFWLWFIMVGIIGRVLAGKSLIPKLVKAASPELLKALAWIGIGSFLLFGIFGVGSQVGSWFFHSMFAMLSWAGFLSIPELVKRRSAFSKREYYRKLEDEIANSKTMVPRIRKPNQDFIDKTSFEFPIAPQHFESLPEESLADKLAESVVKLKGTAVYIESSLTEKTRFEKAQRQARSGLLCVLSAYCKANPEREVEQVAVDVLAPAPPVPSLFSTPILETGPPGDSLCVRSRFGSTPVRTLSEPLLAADLVSAAGEGEEKSHGGFSYKPKLVESKFSKPIE